MILFGIIFVWIVAARSLNRQFLDLNARKEKEQEDEDRALEVEKALKTTKKAKTPAGSAAT